MSTQPLQEEEWRGGGLFGCTEDCGGCKTTLLTQTARLHLHLKTTFIAKGIFYIAWFVRFEDMLFAVYYLWRDT